MQDRGSGANRSLRTLGILAATDLLTEGLKRITHEERPNHSDRLSFPSGHASIAFALATTRAQFHPRESPYWYTGATLIAASRVRLHRHYLQDVIAGAAFGHFTALWVLKHWHDPPPSAEETSLIRNGSGLGLRMRF